MADFSDRYSIGLPHLYSGKVRELYEVSCDRLLMVASDRVSVFDVVLPDEIPDKGRVLTGVSQFWFDQTADIVANHVISSDPTDFPETAGDVGGRAMLVQTTTPIPLECVVRGHLFGGGWKEYTERGTVGGFAAPAGLQQAEVLPEPLFTPSTKAESGHDLPLTAPEGGRGASDRRCLGGCLQGALGSVRAADPGPDLRKGCGWIGPPGSLERCLDIGEGAPAARPRLRIVQDAVERSGATHTWGLAHTVPTQADRRRGAQRLPGHAHRTWHSGVGAVSRSPRLDVAIPQQDGGTRARPRTAGHRAWCGCR